MPHDKNGRALKVGDVVTVEFRVARVDGGEDLCNCLLGTTSGRRPDNATETFTCNTGVVSLVKPKEIGNVVVCSLGRVGVITGKKIITFGNGDTGEMYVGMGLDGKGLWASSEPVVIADSLEDYTKKILEKPSNVLYGTIAVSPPKKEKNNVPSPVDGVGLALGFKPE